MSMYDDILSLVRRSQAYEQQDQRNIETNVTYAVALKDSVDGQVAVEFVGGAGTLEDPQSEPADGVQIVDDIDMDNNINSGQEDDDDLEEESGSSEDE